MADGTLRLLLGQAVLQDLRQGVLILQAGVGAAGDLGRVAAVPGGPEVHGEIRQQHPVAADGDGNVWPVHAAANDCFLGDPLENLTAETGDVPGHGKIDGEKHCRQDNGDQRHADGHKFQPQLADHGRCSLLVKNMVNMWKTMWRSRKTYDFSRQ